MTDNTTTKRKRTKGQTTIDKKTCCAHYKNMEELMSSPFFLEITVVGFHFKLRNVKYGDVLWFKHSYYIFPAL